MQTADPMLIDALSFDHAATRRPFPWQLALTERLIAGQIPRALDLPTGLGKTSVMAAFVVAHVLGAKLPRRLVYVVDRRAVVDQATTEAERLRRWVGADPDRVAALGLASGQLPISTLRGQFVDNREWLDDPSVPAIVVGTVDMIGSRLLFEGYGTSRKMRPYHAGMLACDALFVLDEAHLVPPFERLLEQAFTRAELWAAELPRSRVTSLSATGRDVAGDVLRLGDADRAHPIVRQRVHATKRLTVDVVPAKQLPDQLAASAWSIADASDTPVRLIVFSHRRDTAERAQRALEKLVGKARGRRAALPAIDLFVGGRRIKERRDAEMRLRQLGFLAGSEPAVDHAFLFATSAAEVGVDLDADHVVADGVAWERMVQRLGRVNRRGEGDATVRVHIADDEPLRDNLLALIERLPQLEDGTRDVSPAALDDLRAAHGSLVRETSTPEPLFPPLRRPLLDAWSMTSLPEHTGRPEVGPWLRGWIDQPPQTSVVWRTRLPMARNSERRTDRARDAEIAAWFDATPPHLSERLDTETFRVVEWLSTRAGAARSTDEAARPGSDEVVAHVLDGANRPIDRFTRADLVQETASSRVKERLVRRLAGAQLVVDAQLGGLSTAGLLDPAANDLPTTADSPDAWLIDGEPVTGWRVRETHDPDPTADPDWRERLRIVARPESDAEEPTWWVVDKWHTDSATEDDRSSGPAQRLDEHQAWVRDEAERLATRLGLTEPLTRALVLAAELHDEGKRAPVWQRAFHAKRDAVYAKTRGPVNVRLLDGYRHELGSLPFAEADARLGELDAATRDLVLHLVTAHHGFARPLIPTRGAHPEPPSVLESRAAEVMHRFLRLQEAWGPWGLAWLETLLRAADQRASRRNDRRGAKEVR